MTEAARLPFVKWPGGKRWLAPALIDMVGESEHRRYIEPFVGGGAVYFASRFERSVLADSNDELITAFTAVRDKVELVVRRLRELPDPSKQGYALVASSQPRTLATRAARFLYLNRLAFNGVWRVNTQGTFNVPYGHRPPLDLVGAAQLRSCSQALQGCTLRSGDFRDSLRLAGPDDLIYCDPPYTVSHNNNGFIRYNEKLFRWVDQQALAARATELAAAGARVVVSNAAHADVLQLYPLSEFHAFRILRTSRVASANQFRQPQAEMLFVSRNLFEDRRRASRALRSALGASAHVELL